MSPIEHPVVRRFIEDAGNLTQALGFGRVTGQIYALLYFSADPSSLDDLKRELAISKGSASMCVRQLETLGAVQRVWVKGDRKDYYQANDYFGQIIRRGVQEIVGRRVETLGRFIEEADQTVTGENGDVFIRQRLDRLRAFQKKAQKFWDNPLVKVMLK